MAINNVSLKYDTNYANLNPVGGGARSHTNYYDVEPKTALEWSFSEALEKLGEIVGKEELRDIFLGKEIKAPTSKEKNSEWIKNSKIIGVNPRAIGTYFDIVKYAMTFPEDSIHLLPLFEQGCQRSLYAPVNFKLSDEFMDENLTKLGFDTPEKQLKLTINLLHSLNKNVGMDFLQHTDRYSEEVFLNPDNFIWAKLDDNSTRELQYPEIVPDKTGDEVKELVVEFLRKEGDAKGREVSEKTLSNFYNLTEESKRRILFNGSSKRRIELMKYIRAHHLETKPLSIDDPKRKIVFREMKSNSKASWAEFTDNVNDKIFGNLAAYKLYHLDENGEVDVSRPNFKAWDFLCDKTAEFQRNFGFDFLRADMGYLSFNDDSLDIHKEVKRRIQSYDPHFAAFGECFAGFSDTDPRAIDRKNYDAVLGNLQYKNVYDSDFLNTVKSYNFHPDYKIAITSITTDSDQACYNKHYDNFQNKLRCFLGLFLNQPSYMGMGLETRDVDPVEGKNLTKDFINDWGIEKYEWGQNKDFFNLLSGMRKTYSSIKDTITNQLHYWLQTDDEKVGSWFYYSKKDKNPSYLFVANTDVNKKEEVEIQNPVDVLDKDKAALNSIYSTDKKKLEGKIIYKGKSFKVTNLAPGECRVYKVVSTK